MAFTALGCEENLSEPPDLGWGPTVYSVMLSTRVLVAPRGDTVNAELETDAPPSALYIDEPPPGVTIFGPEECCVSGQSTVRFAVDPDAPLGNYELEFRLASGEEHIVESGELQLSVVADQTGSPLRLSTVVVTGSRPSAISIHPDGQRGSVPDKHSHTITTIDLDGNRASRRVLVHPDADPQIPRSGDGPVAVAFTAGDTAYIANRYSDLLTRRVLSYQLEDPVDVPVAAGPSAVALDTDARLAYITAWDGYEVSVVDLTTHEVTDSIAVGVAPYDIEIVPGGTAYVTNWGSDDVSVIDLDARSVVGTIPVGDRPVGLTLSADGTAAYVTNSGSDDVSILDLVTLTVTGRVEVGTAPHDVAVTSDGTTAYVANAESDDVSIVDLAGRRVVGSAAAGDRPVAVALRPDGAFLYVVNEWGDDVYAFDLRDPDVADPTPTPR